MLDQPRDHGVDRREQPVLDGQTGDGEVEKLHLGGLALRLDLDHILSSRCCCFSVDRAPSVPRSRVWLAVRFALFRDLRAPAAKETKAIVPMR